MKTQLLIWLSLACIAGGARAALLAHVETTVGTITVELHFDKAPRTVANFITMAQGTRARVDPRNGAITTEPLYVGENFFRTNDNDFAKFAQTGSGTGSNSGSTGFTFKDEFDPSLRHTGYTLSMANSGPNTNGGQIFFTGNVSIPTYDDRHTILGSVTDAASQAVVDAVIAAGDDGSSIISIEFERTDEAAQNFDEHAQDLPTVFQPKGKLRVTPGVRSYYDLTIAATSGEVVTAYRSDGSNGWSEVFNQHIGISRGALLTPALVGFNIDDASLPAALYRINLARHPGAVAPSHLDSRAITLDVPGGTFEFAFDNSGSEGTTTFTPDSGDPIGGPCELFSFRSSAHHANIIVDTPSMTPRFVQISIGADSATNSLVSGRQITSYWNGFQFRDNPAGTCTITRN